MKASLLSLGLAPLLIVSSAVAAEPGNVHECIAANEDGQHLRRAGKLRDAEALFRFCTAAACPKPLREDCVARLAETRRAMPTFVLVIKDAHGGAVTGVRIIVDGAPVRTDDRTPLSVDPGTYRFEFLADGYRPGSREVFAREGVSVREEVLLERAPSTAAERRGVFGLSRDLQTKLAYVAAGSGVVGLGVGSYFGLQAKFTYDDATATNCPRGVSTCNQAGVDGVDSARSQATVSTIALILGAALLTGGVVLSVKLPATRSASSTPSIHADLAGNVWEWNLDSDAPYASPCDDVPI